MKTFQHNNFLLEPKPKEEKAEENIPGEVVTEDAEKSEKVALKAEQDCEVQIPREQEVLIEPAPKLESEFLPVIVEEVADIDSDKLPMWCTPVKSINSGPGTNKIKLAKLSKSRKPAQKSIIKFSWSDCLRSKN